MVKDLVTEGKPLIELAGVNKYYPLGKNAQLHVLKELNLTINQGEFVMIMGKSGSGKTTLLNIIGMLDQLTTGEYFFNEKPVAGLSENEKSELRNANLGFIFQQFFLIDSLNVSQNVSLPMVYKGHKNSSYRREQAQKYLELVGIPEKEKQKTTELSGGQQQRVAIARALVNDPLMIMADEPTGALDSETGIAIMDILTSLNDHGKTIVMVTHDEDMTRYASRVVHLKDGEIIQEIHGKRGEVKS
ncbi:MAG: ABC transporter ATP-binding protein [Clostridiales Family XIII bacterium]|jgi:putative ABC transport system ATP-binding protein|nr:ABC transporter ATP-binding protein [Clostridiales Family XIII bacterium]